MDTWCQRAGGGECDGKGGVGGDSGRAHVGSTSSLVCGARVPVGWRRGVRGGWWSGRYGLCAYQCWSASPSVEGLAAVSRMEPNFEYQE